MATERLKVLIEEHGMRNVKRALKELDGAATGVSSSFASIASSIGLTVVAGMALNKVVQTGKEFEKEMAKTKSVTYDTSITTEQLNAQWDRLEKNARKLGGSTLYTAQEVAGLQTEYAKLGFTVPEIENLSKATLDLALVAGTDLANATAVAGVTLRAFGMDSSQSTEMMDIMAMSFSSTALDMEKFSNAMTYVAPVASAAGFSMEETTAVLGTLANVGIDGSMAGTQLRLVFGELANGSSKLSQKLGGPIDNLDDLVPKLIEMRDGGFDVTEAFDMVGRRAAPGLLALVENAENLDELAVDLEGANGQLSKMADIQLQTFAGQMDLLNSATSELSLKIWDMVQGPLADLVTGFSDWVEDIDEEEIKAYATGIGLAAGAFATYKTYVMLAAWANNQFAISLTRTGIGALIVGLGIAIGGFLDYIGVFDTATEKTKEQEEAEAALEERQRRVAEGIDDLVKHYQELGVDPATTIDILTEKLDKQEEELLDWTSTQNDAEDAIDKTVDAIEGQITGVQGLGKVYDENGKILDEEMARLQNFSMVLDENGDLVLESIEDTEKQIEIGQELVLNMDKIHVANLNYQSDMQKRNQVQTNHLVIANKTKEQLIAESIAIDAVIDQEKEIIETTEGKIDTLKEEIEVTEGAIAEIRKLDKAQDQQARLTEAVNAIYDSKLEKQVTHRETMVLEILATQALQNELMNITVAHQEEIRARVEKGESMESILHSLGLEQEGTASLTALYNEHVYAKDKSNRQDAIAIAQTEDILEGIAKKAEADGLTLEVTEQLMEQKVELIEGLLEEGLAREKIVWMLENEKTVFDELEYAKATAMENEEERNERELALYQALYAKKKLAMESTHLFGLKLGNVAQVKMKQQIDDEIAAYNKLEKNKTKQFFNSAKVKVKLHAAAAQSAFDNAASGFAAAAKQDKKFAEAAKVAAHAQALINTYTSATKAASATPFPWNIAAVAGAIAQGMANVKQINSTNFGPDPPTDTFVADGNLSDIEEEQFGTDGPVMVDRPTTFKVGEGYAPEAVDVKPLTMANANLAKKYGKRSGNGGGPISLNITAPLVDEHVVDTLIPAIRDALRQGETLES